MRKVIAPAVAQFYLTILSLALPVMPLMASILFWRSKYAFEYRATLKKLRVHIAALKEGPAQHYFHDVMGRESAVPQEIHGECVQCGNCCMDRRCVFLEATEDAKYLCGIYHSPFRKLSNCGSFPLNQAEGGTGLNSALAVWITRLGEIEPLQATGGWLDKPVSP